jgi:hypothetical protein
MDFHESTNYAAACRSLERENQEALAEAQERAKSEGRDPEECRAQDGREVTRPQRFSSDPAESRNHPLVLGIAQPWRATGE